MTDLFVLASGQPMRTIAGGPTLTAGETPSTSRGLLALHLGEDLARLLEGGVGRRDAAIDHGLEQDLADLLPGDAVAECGADVELELLLAVERGQHGEVEEAPGL